MFGFPRLKETVGKVPGGQALIDRVLSDLDEFCGAGVEQEDDITMVTLERSGGERGKYAEGEERVLAEFQLTSRPGEEREAISRVSSAVRGLDIDPLRLERLGTAVGEATMNAMEHGNEYRPELPVSIRVVKLPDQIRVKVSDSGGEGELQPAEKPDLEAKLEGRQTPRGWGLFLIDKMVDEVNVTSDGGHTLELIMRLGGGIDGDS